MMWRRACKIVALCSLLSCAAGTAAGAELSLEDAVERVQKEIQGRVLTAEEVHIGKKKLYRIKLLTRDGRVQVVQIPADDKEKE